MKEEKKIVELNIDDILPNRFQPRIKFDERAINELAGSIKEYGVIQPILVREMGDKYEIIAGERRYKASVLAGRETIPAIINNLNDKESAEVALIENIQRKDLTPIEEAVSYKKILDMGYLNQEALASKLDKAQSSISNKLRLLNLDEEVQESLLNNQISERHARSLLRIENKDLQKEMLNKIIVERLTVRKTDEEIDGVLNISKAPEENRKEANMNNEDTKGIFNIPTSPIIEEIEIFDEFDQDDQDFNQIIVDKNQGINTDTNFKPGFMDIDKIEQNAEQINIEKAPADLDSLLKLDDNMVDNNMDKNVLESEETEDQNIVHGKFFSFLDDTEENQKNKIDDNQFNNFDFNLDNYSDVSLETENKIDNIDEELPEINYDSISLNDDNNLLEKPVTAVIEEDGFSINTENKVIEPDYNFNFDDLFGEKSTINSNSVNSPIEDTVPDYSIPGIDNQEENNNNFKNFNEVLTEIREYSKKIEDYGFFVEVDELDFGDTYQVTFKINKNQ